MTTLDGYFKDKTKNLTFIELKEESKIELKDYIIKDNVPLPLLASELIKGIKEGQYVDEISVDDIIEGIIYTMGTDSDFPYIKEYKEILIAFDKDIIDKVFYKAIIDFEKDRFDEGCIKLRAILVLDPNNTNIMFNYGLGIEAIAKKTMETDKENGELFLNHSTEMFEKALEVDKDFALAYYRLGYHYLFNEKYLKASLTWERFISLSDDELLVQEIRNELDSIRDDVIYETGLSYLIFNDYDKALDYLLKLMPRYKDNWDLNYAIGRCYKGLQEYDIAIKYIYIALELNKDNSDLYNELGIIYTSIGDINKAIEVFSKGINSSKDFTLLFNRAMTYVQIDEYEKALDDISKAYDLEPNDDIKAQRDYIKTIVEEGKYK